MTPKKTTSSVHDHHLYVSLFVREHGSRVGLVARAPTHAKSGTSCLYPGYADVALVTSSGLKMVLLWRKKALRPGAGFFRS